MFCLVMLGVGFIVCIVFRKNLNYSFSPFLSTSIETLLLFRLFSCGTSKDGDSFLVEWNESEGAIKRTYTGFRKKSANVVQFDTTQNHFLAVGEDSQIKFWDMDNINTITTTDAEGGLPVSFNVLSYHVNAEITEQIA